MEDELESPKPGDEDESSIQGGEVDEESGEVFVGKIPSSEISIGVSS